MTGQEFTQMFVVLDAIWGGLDEGLELGYRHVLADYPCEVVTAAVNQLAQGRGRRPEDARWLPRPPEIALLAQRLMREQRALTHLQQLRARIARALEPGGADVA